MARFRRDTRTGHPSSTGPSARWERKERRGCPHHWILAALVVSLLFATCSSLPPPTRGLLGAKSLKAKVKKANAKAASSWQPPHLGARSSGDRLGAGSSGDRLGAGYSGDRLGAGPSGGGDRARGASLPPFVSALPRDVECGGKERWTGKFVLIAIHRSGSTSLAKLLSHVEGVNDPSRELFNMNRARWTGRWNGTEPVYWADEARVDVDDVLTAERNDNGYDRVGFKFLEEVRVLPVEEFETAFLDDPDVKKIVLVRYNLLEQAASAMKARKTQVWWHEPGTAAHHTSDTQISIPLTFLAESTKQKMDFYYKIMSRLMENGEIERGNVHIVSYEQMMLSEYMHYVTVMDILRHLCVPRERWPTLETFAKWDALYPKFETKPLHHSVSNYLEAVDEWDETRKSYFYRGSSRPDGEQTDS